MMSDSMKHITEEDRENLTVAIVSAENYIGVTGAARATATRDLQNLVEIGALTKTGERKYTRYYLKDV
jgi:Fic family protein